MKDTEAERKVSKIEVFRRKNFIFQVLKVENIEVLQKISNFLKFGKISTFSYRYANTLNICRWLSPSQFFLFNLFSKGISPSF